MLVCLRTEMQNGLSLKDSMDAVSIRLISSTISKVLFMRTIYSHTSGAQVWSQYIKTDQAVLRSAVSPTLRNTFLFRSRAITKLAYILETIWETQSSHQSPPLNFESSKSKKIQVQPTTDKRTYVNFNLPLGSDRREDIVKTMAH